MEGARTTPPVPRGVVLVADDSPVVRALISQYLMAAGYEVREAVDGADALRHLAQTPVDAVVTDLHMPEMDGFGLLETVRSRSLATEVIILTQTHADDIAAAIRALRLGAHDYLTKPPSGPDELVHAVDRAVEKKRLKETNLRLLQELEALIRTDGLTGVGNRRAFDEVFRREVARATRYDIELSLVILDLDHFKAINDRHGHPVGDAVLRFVATAMKTAFRESDAVYRYGGEEFTAVLPHTPLEGAVVSTQRFLTGLAETSWPSGFLALQVTASAGVASARGRELEGLDLVALADQALYKAKEAGRNRVVADRSPRKVSDAEAP